MDKLHCSAEAFHRVLVLATRDTSLPRNGHGVRSYGPAVLASTSMGRTALQSIELNKLGAGPGKAILANSKTDFLKSKPECRGCNSALP